MVVIKIAVLFTAVIVVSSVVLFFGLRFLLEKANFCNYGIAPADTLFSVSQFIAVYIIISLANLLLLFALGLIIFYFEVHDLILPIIRITSELKSGQIKEITIRKKDALLAPLVKNINRLLKR